MAPKFMGMGSSMHKFPVGPTSKAGRCGALLVWAKPSPTRVRVTGTGRKILANLGTVVLRGQA